MRNVTFDGISFNHNSDFSGEVIITKSEEEISIPISTLEKFIEYKEITIKKEELISEIEQLEESEINSLLLELRRIKSKIF